MRPTSAQIPAPYDSRQILPTKEYRDGAMQLSLPLAMTAPLAVETLVGDNLDGTKRFIAFPAHATFHSELIDEPASIFVNRLH